MELRHSVNEKDMNEALLDRGFQTEFVTMEFNASPQWHRNLEILYILNGHAVDNYYSGQIFEAQSKICKLLSELIASDKLGFLLSDIDRSYSTRLLAPFPDLQQTSIDNQKIYEKIYSGSGIA